MKKAGYFALAICVLAFVLLTRKGIAHAADEGTPRLLLESYTVTGDGVAAGGEFELTMKIRNTSAASDIFGVVVTVTDDAGAVFPVYGSSNQCYIERVYARNSWNVVMSLKASEEISRPSIPLKVSLSYGDDVSGARQNEAVISIPVRVGENGREYETIEGGSGMETAGESAGAENKAAGAAGYGMLMIISAAGAAIVSAVIIALLKRRR